MHNETVDWYKIRRSKIIKSVQFIMEEIKNVL